MRTILLIMAMFIMANSEAMFPQVICPKGETYVVIFDSNSSVPRQGCMKKEKM